MLIFYTNRELALKLDVNLARWKRWSRQFLPPDPLGGLQSGFARQYSPDQALTVFLGGHLLGGLKFSVPEARQILADLRPWFERNGLYVNPDSPAGRPGPAATACLRHEITIYRKKTAPGGNPCFGYLIRNLVSRTRIVLQNQPAFEERWIEERLPDEPPGASQTAFESGLLRISEVLSHFAAKLDLKADLFKMLRHYSPE